MEQNRDKNFRLFDILYLLMMILPLVAGILLKILTKPAAEGIAITGAQIYFTIPMPLQDFPITESQINSALVIIAVLGLCLFLTHGLTSVPGAKISKRQAMAEWIIEMTEKLVKENMGEYFAAFPPFIGAIMALSAFSSLLALLGLYPPTSDLNIVGGWAILVFILITYYKMKCGPLHYVKTLCDPIPLTPLNVISEVATPVSMAFRHYGNILSGSVISVLVAAALQGLSSMLLGWLPGFLGDIPFLQVGLPAILSVYFDVFSSLLQAFIFAMLTMLYIGSGFPADEWEKLKAKKTAAKAANS